METQSAFTYSWHIDEEETNRTIIRVYALNEQNENTCLIINNFQPYIYLELPENIEWTYSKASLVSSKFNSLLQDHKPLSYELVFKKRLYYANLDKNLKKKTYPFLHCCFSHPEDIKQLGYKIRKPIMIAGLGTLNFKMHEQNANPILQLTSNRNISPTGWINFQGKRVQEADKVTHCKHEFVVNYKTITYKELSVISKPLLMGYDIEVNSSIPSSMPKAFRPPDKVFQISCVFSRQGSKPDTYEKYLLTLGEPNMDMLDNIEVICYETEADLLLGFVELMKEKQPNICIGYNIFTFDIPYMLERAKMLYIAYDFDKQGMGKYMHARERTIEWSSSAYKNQSFQFLDAEGIIFVDLLPLVRRDYKMANYQLKTISSYFLKDMTKDPLDHHAIFKCYRIGMKGGDKGKKAIALVGKYCVKDSELVVRLFEVLTTWYALTEMSKITNVPIFQLYTQGQQLKVFSQVYKKCTHENTVVIKDGYIANDNDYFEGAKVFQPKPGVYENVVPLDFSSMYVSIMVSHNISYDTFVTDEKIPDDLCTVLEWEEHISCVHDPKEIRKVELNNIIKEMDSNLKKMREERDKKENKNNKEEFKEKIEEYIKTIKPFREERSELQKSKNKHVICCHRKHRWLKSSIYVGVIPEILKGLTDARTNTRKEMKIIKEKLKTIKEGSEEYNDLEVYLDVLDQRQKALKVSGNSAYGSLGVKHGFLPFMPGSASTTFVGRTSITKTCECVQKVWGGQFVYGDTDSNYVIFPHIKTTQELWDYCLKVAAEVSKLFPPPMKLEFEEKIYAKFLILTKKRYMSLTCDRNGKMDTKIDKKGIVLSRRDNSEIVRTIYASVVMLIFNKAKLDEIVYYILEELNKIFSGCIPYKDFIITKSVGEINNLEPREGTDKNGKKGYFIGDYKVKLLPRDEKLRNTQFKLKNCNTEQEYYLRCLPAQAQLAEKMRERGALVAAGSRIEYVITTTGGVSAKQYVKIESIDYFLKNSNILKIDYFYYLKQLASALDQILNVICEGKLQKDFMLSQYNYRLKIREKVLDQIRNFSEPRLKFEK